MPVVHADPDELPRIWPATRRMLLIHGQLRQRRLEALKMTALVQGKASQAVRALFDVETPMVDRDWTQLNEKELRELYERSTGLKLDAKGQVIRDAR